MNLLNSIDVGAYLGVSKRTVRRLIDQHDLPFFKVGRLIRFSQKDLDNYLNEHRVEKVK